MEQKERKEGRKKKKASSPLSLPLLASPFLFLHWKGGKKKERRRRANNSHPDGEEVETGPTDTFPSEGKNPQVVLRRKKKTKTREEPEAEEEEGNNNNAKGKNRLSKIIGSLWYPPPEEGEI